MVAASSRVGRLSAFCSWFSARAGWRSACVDRGCHSCPRILYSLLFLMKLLATMLDTTCDGHPHRGRRCRAVRCDHGARRAAGPASAVPSARRSDDRDTTRQTRRENTRIISIRYAICRAVRRDSRPLRSRKTCRAEPERTTPRAREPCGSLGSTDVVRSPLLPALSRAP